MIDKANAIDKNFSQKTPISVSFSAETVGNFRVYIDRKVKHRSFLKELSKADVISEKIGFNIWENVHSFNVNKNLGILINKVSHSKLDLYHIL